MRTIYIKPGVSKYRLRGDDKKEIGMIIITYTPGEKCTISVSECGESVDSLSIIPVEVA